MVTTCPHYGDRTDNKADSVSLWAMRDDHTFKRYRSTSVDALIEDWRRDLKSNSSLSLCPIIVKEGEKELRRVGEMVHPDYKLGVPKDENAVIKFRETALADPDISRLMAKSV